MKKFWALLAVTIIVLAGCGRPSIEKTLTEGDGKWEGDGFGVQTELIFFDDGQINVVENGSNYGGEYNYDAKNKKLSINLTGISKTILTDVSQEDNKIIAKNGEKKVTLEKINDK
ncbi:hypothetical protein D929_00165 [Enterococcus faecalis 02-MB-P-10]|uniref:hypothetical protein n=1 Tax=Enterococcus faecalis TaxID=1351 RepID=UPI0003536A2F|nr:hypothetical protein [Enterococcus faecalis]EPH77281.1 hypothetical protein D929_00165 [Enterococcus faecalis 02-MB-P-10]